MAYKQGYSAGKAGHPQINPYSVSEQYSDYSTWDRGRKDGWVHYSAGMASY